MKTLHEAFADTAYDSEAFVVGGECWLIGEDTLPVSPDMLETGRLIVQHHQTQHTFPALERGYTIFADRIGFYAEPLTYRYLGFLIFAALFDSRDRLIVLKLTHPESMIKELVLHVAKPGLDDHIPAGLHMRPRIFSYQAQDPFKFPWRSENGSWLPSFTDAFEFPSFALSEGDGSEQEEQWWKTRKTVVMASTYSGAALFAELLLNVSRDGLTYDEFHLESEFAFGGVAPGSAEASLWLPGSFGWMPEFTFD